MHKPVLLKETINALQPRVGGVYIDGTIGGGGHAAAILEASAPTGRLFGFDRDKEALEIAARQLAVFGARVRLFHANFDQLSLTADRYRWPKVDGVLLDLGLSSLQLDQPERGFSFQVDAALDMRMDPTAGRPAADLVNKLPQEELANLIYQYGEERYSRRIAKAIAAARPVSRTKQLADIVARVVPTGGGKARRKRDKPRIHPATRTFQALRIAVNDELGALERVLPQALELLKPGGRLAVISFHSLEDRIVKRYFKQEAQDCLCPPKQVICTCDHKATVRILTRKPVGPASAEIAENPRARSARLRVVESIKV